MSDSEPARRDSRQDKIFNTHFILLFCMSLSVYCVFYMVNSIMTDYCTTELGMTVTMAGVAAVAANISSCAVIFIAGPMSNRVDKRTSLRLAMIFFAVSALGVARSTSLPALIFFRVINGFAGGINFTNAMVMVADALPASKMTEGIGYYGLANNLMQALGPSIGIALIGAFGYRSAFLFSFMLAAAGFLFTLRIPPSLPAPNLKPLRSLGPREYLSEVLCKESWLPATLGFLFGLTNGLAMFLILPYTKSLGFEPRYAGTYFMAASVSMITSRILLGKFIQSRTISFAVNICAALLVFCPILLGLGSSVAAMLTAAVFFGAGYGSLLPVTQSASLKLAPAGRKASGSGTFYIGQTLSTSVAPPIGSFLADPLKLNLGYRRVFLLLVIPCAAAVVIAYFKGRIPINTEA